MIGLIQRVSEASVTIDAQVTARIGMGLLVLVGIEQGDSLLSAEKLLKKILAYRVFSDENDKMNLGLEQVQGELLLVPQFTLVADTSKGLRPGFSRGASRQGASALFGDLVKMAEHRYPGVGAGTFGADMKVQLVNNGPVTFWLQVAPESVPI